MFFIEETNTIRQPAESLARYSLSNSSTAVVTTAMAFSAINLYLRNVSGWTSRKHRRLSTM